MHTHFFRPLARTIAVSLLAMVVLFPLRARGDDAPKAAPVTGKCMMWKVSSGTATVYLVGSIHMATPDMYPLPKEMDEAFAKSDVLVVEVNINKSGQAEAMKFIAEKGMYKDNETLTANISKESARALEDFCKSLNIPANVFDKLKPWVVSLTVEVLAIQNLGLDPTLGIDKHFLDIAEKNSRKIEELESADFQLNVLSNFDPALQVKALDAALEEVKDVKKDLGEMTGAWKIGDAAAMSEFLSKSMKKHPELAEYHKKIIDDRNGPMANRVETYLKGNQTIFVIAGCAHMVGEKGVVKILEDHKFKVEQSSATIAEEKKAE
jgi:uncharacterized protein YbaP (TraB family)